MLGRQAFPAPVLPVMPGNPAFLPLTLSVHPLSSWWHLPVLLHSCSDAHVCYGEIFPLVWKSLFHHFAIDYFWSGEAIRPAYPRLSQSPSNAQWQHSVILASLGFERFQLDWERSGKQWFHSKKQDCHLTLIIIINNVWLGFLVISFYLLLVIIVSVRLEQ